MSTINSVTAAAYTTTVYESKAAAKKENTEATTEKSYGKDVGVVYEKSSKSIEVKRKLLLPLFAHSRHIAFPPVLVYGFGAIFGKITAIEPLKISRSISDKNYRSCSYVYARNG